MPDAPFEIDRDAPGRPLVIVDTARPFFALDTGCVVICRLVDFPANALDEGFFIVLFDVLVIGGTDTLSFAI